MCMDALPVCIPVYHMHVVTLDPLELEPPMVISCFWVLGIGLRAFGTVASDLKL